MVVSSSNRHTIETLVFRLDDSRNLVITMLWALWSIPGMRDKLIYGSELFWRD